MKRLIVLLMVVVLAGVVAVAQDEEEIYIGDCSQDVYDGIAVLLDEMAEELRAGELNQETVLQTQISIATLRAFCDGYIFDSEEYGMDVVTDPIVLRDGLYRGILVADSFTSLTLEEVSGDCDFGGWFITNSDGGEEQELVEIEDCIAIIEANSSVPWTFTLEPIALAEE